MNKKEEVLDIKLTQYGKKLLSEGKLRPAYYAFYDDNILYDSQYGGFTEPQNDAQDRIIDTAQLKTQHKFTSKFTELGSIIITNPDGTKEKIPVSQVSQNLALQSPLGTSDLESRKFPALKMKTFGGEITNVDLAYTSSLGKNIPQVDYKVKAAVSIRQVSDAQEYANPFGDFSSAPAADGSYLSILMPEIVVMLEETGVDFDNENFDIEVFSSASSGELTPLNFSNKEEDTPIINGILQDVDSTSTNFIIPQSTDVEYYFDTIVDDNIPTSTLAKANATFKSSGFYNDSAQGYNKGNTILEISDIYSSNVTSDHIEECD